MSRYHRQNIEDNNIQNSSHRPAELIRDQVVHDPYSQCAVPSLSHASISDDCPKPSPVFFEHFVPRRQVLY